VLTILFLTPLFTNLPEAVLGALIIHAVWHLIIARKLQQIRLVTRTGFWLGVITMAGVLLIDVLQGMIIGLVCSLLLVVYKSSRPHISSLGRIPGIPGAYADLIRHPENLPVPGVLILRLDVPLYYANALTVQDRVKTLVDETEPLPRAVILDATVQEELDLTGAEMLKGLVMNLQGKGVSVYVAEVHAPAAEFSRRTGLYDLIGEEHMFPTVDAAVRSLEASA